MSAFLQQIQQTRRQMLSTSALSLAPISLAALMEQSSQGAEQTTENSPPPRIAPHVPPRANSVIFLFQIGGPSQLETFDMKPDAPSNVRGPFQPIAARTHNARSETSTQRPTVAWR